MSISADVPKYLEQVALQYWSGIQQEKRDQALDALDPDAATLDAYTEANGIKAPATKLQGRDAIVDQGLKMMSLVKSIENFSIRFGLLSNEKGEQRLLWKYEQQLELKSPEEEQDVDIELSCKGVEAWTWQEIEAEGGQKKTVLVSGILFENDLFSQSGLVPPSVNLGDLKALPIDLSRVPGKIEMQDPPTQVNWCNLV